MIAEILCPAPWSLTEGSPRLGVSRVRSCWSISSPMGDEANLTAQIADLSARLDAYEHRAGLTTMSADTWWLLSNGALVFFMQCGFGMLEAGSVTARATQNIVRRNSPSNAHARGAASIS